MFRFQRGNTLFAVGHMALAYLLATAFAKLLKVNINIPLILVLSIIPDIDLLFEPLIPGIHRGPTHSIIMAILFFIPFLALYRKKAIPYFAALTSHSLIGDFFIGGQLQLLWPLSTRQFGLHELGLPYINIYNPINITLELALFALALVVMLKTRDLLHFTRNSKTTLILTIPIFTILLPTFLSYPTYVPMELVLPHLFYLALFSISIFVMLRELMRKIK
jgi:membrane-bound metal-dependent hydrolase YbcI (DUF457 family)